MIQVGNFEDWKHLSLLCVFLSLMKCSYIVRLLIKLYEPQHKETKMGTHSLPCGNQCPGGESLPSNQGLELWKSLHIIKNNFHLNGNDMKAEALINMSI